MKRIIRRVAASLVGTSVSLVALGTGATGQTFAP